MTGCSSGPCLAQEQTVDVTYRQHTLFRRFRQKEIRRRDGFVSSRCEEDLLEIDAALEGRDRSLVRAAKGMKRALCRTDVVSRDRTLDV
jgi:hypothetical protein